VGGVGGVKGLGGRGGRRGGGGGVQAGGSAWVCTEGKSVTISSGSAKMRTRQTSVAGRTIWGDWAAKRKQQWRMQ